MKPFGPPNVKKLTDKRDISGLIRALSYQKDTRSARRSPTQYDVMSVRKAAADALGQIGDARAVEPLIAVVSDEIRDVAGLVHPGSGLLGAVEEGGVPVVGLVGHAGTLGQKMPPALDETLQILDALTAAAKVSANDELQDLRCHAIDALGRIGDARAINPLIAVLNHRYRRVYEQGRYGHVRKHAIDALGRIGDAQAVKSLIATLADENSDVRAAAARALGQIRTPAVEHLITALTASNEHVREAAADALGQIGDARAIGPLSARLEDGNWDVRAASARALGQICDARPVGALIAALNQQDRKLCVAAADALGQIGDARAIEPLIAALKHRDPDVRTAAAAALDRLGWRPG